MRDKLFYVPKGAREFIEAKLKERGLSDFRIYCRIEKYLYLLHKIREQRIYGHSTKKNNGYSLLSRKSLEVYISSRWFDEIRDDLIKWGIINWDKSYVAQAQAESFGVTAKSQGYKLTKFYAAQPTVDEMVLNDKMAEKLRKKAFLLKYEKSTHQYLYDCLVQIEIDAEGAYRKADELLHNSLQLLRSLPDNHFSRYMRQFSKKKFYKLSKNLEGASLQKLEEDLISRHIDNKILIQKIEMGDFELSPDIYGRVHTVMTNISSQLRPYIKFKRCPEEVLWNIDIKNSQPFFLAVQLNDFYMGHDMPPDVASFIDSCEKGDCYERFMCAAGLDSTDEDKREKVKRLLYRKTLFCKETACEEANNEVAQYFKSVYPNVLDFINKIKTRTPYYDCYKEFGQGLQKTEAQMIQQVVGRCKVQGIWILTIHDSIITQERHRNEVYSIMLEVSKAECLLAPVLTEKALIPNKESNNQSEYSKISINEPPLFKIENKDRYSLCTDKYNILLKDLKAIKDRVGANAWKNQEYCSVIHKLVPLREELDCIEAKRKKDKKKQQAINKKTVACDFSHLQPLIEHFSFLGTRQACEDDWDYREALIRIERARLRSMTSCITMDVSTVAGWLESDKKMWHSDELMKEGIRARDQELKVSLSVAL